MTVAKLQLVRRRAGRRLKTCLLSRTHCLLLHFVFPEMYLIPWDCHRVSGFSFGWRGYDCVCV